MMAQNESETKIFFYVDDEETPYLVKVPVPLAQVTLQDFKGALQRTNFKFFFKSLDADFGVVKEEIVEDSAVLPAFKGRVVSWLVSRDGSNASDSASQVTASTGATDANGAAIGEGRYYRRQKEHHRSNQLPPHKDRALDQRKYDYDSSSVMTSDVESSTVLDSDDDSDLTSRMSTTTDESSVSRLYHSRQQQLRRRRRKKLTLMSGAASSTMSSITDSSVSLNIITVTLNLDSVNFLGISIVGQSNRGGDGGIYVGSIMKGGAVAEDGRIEPGDMILQVNDISFDQMSNDHAVKVLRDAVQKPGPIKLVVAKCWEPNPKGYFTIPRTEQVRPIDPGAWVAHTEAALGCTPQFLGPGQGACGELPPPLRPPSVSTITSSSLGTEHDSNPLLSLSVDDTPNRHITEAMASPDSGLDVRDRMWLKITIRNAFLGSDCVDWLLHHVTGFRDRKDAKKKATRLLKEGLIKHTVNKSSFSEQCYYVFSDDIVKRINDMRLDTGVGVELSAPTGWTIPTAMPPYTGQYTPQPFLTHPAPPPAHNLTPTYAQPTLPTAYANEASYVNFGREGSVNSSAGSGGSGGATNGQLLPALPKPAVAVAVPLAVGGRSSSASSTSSSSSEHDSQSLLAAPTSAIAQANAASTTTAGQSVLRPGATGGVLVTAPQKSANGDMPSSGTANDGHSGYMNC
ncbi:segment polarity protein dishevelled-like isoform X2 [Varroa jacobsoni]|uniref:Dishevelled n=1 Tax=Varroa destructor TaxID=109461 RepID=A0A7M7KJA9_VARDE|nr:segment polarity protein dishevelled-like isoform X2 [Varroa destructor]XP_022688461.1 segment polarity protein dishevelled-like isoform X2 [Varroa jacobsoni]